MKKRVVFVSMAMAAALLTACGGTQKSETTTAQTTVQTTAGQSTEAQAPERRARGGYYQPHLGESHRSPSDAGAELSAD